MDIKQYLLDELKAVCEANNFEENECFTASYLANLCHISRNTVSQYLNEEVKNHRVIKINSRPVYFFNHSVAEKKLECIINQYVFQSFDEFINLSKRDFEKLIGYNGSLRSLISRCQAAIAYPDHGLPILIHGATGTGKSLLANLMYEYGIHQNILDKNSKFIALNCSEYANNPELLTANLFGHVKGAYTGADEEQPGLIQLADHGVLFLDEVHCLKAECQEKLFQFMDKGIYHKVGDNKNWYQSNCYLIFATTEDPQNVLLGTLLRRIPITIFLPSLKERPRTEKIELIASMLQRESQRIHKNLYISNLAYQALMDHEYAGNIGALQNIIKASCAIVLLHEKEDPLCLRLLDLPDEIILSRKSLQMKYYNQEQEENLIAVSELNKERHLTSPLITLYDHLLEIYQTALEKKEGDAQIITHCKYQIQNFFDQLFFDQKFRFLSSNETYLLKILDKVCSIVMNKYSMIVSNSQIKMYSKAFVEYTKNANDAAIWLSFHQNEIASLCEMIKERYPRDYSVASEIIENASLNLDIQMDEFISYIFALALIDTNKEECNGRVGLILCHGYSTASSIADTANHLLHEHIFDGIDMELHISIDKIVQLVNDYLKQKNPIQELILLVDMGSLEAIYEMISLSNCNIGLMNYVSTATALEVGHMIQQGKPVKDILTEVKDQFALSTHFIEGMQKQNAILTICATGFGVAKKISELFTASFPKEIPLQVVPYEYKSIYDHGHNDTIFSQYDVQLIVGTLDPQIKGIEYLSLESVVANEGIQTLLHYVSPYLNDQEQLLFSQNIMKNFTLSNIVNHLTILNAEKVIDDVEDFVTTLEEKLNLHIDTTIRMGLYVHVSCLIERLMLRQGINYVDGIDNFKKENLEKMKKVKEAFSGIEMHYSVEIPDPEIMYILNYV